MEENKIVIIEDNGDIVLAQDIVIKNVSASRNQVAEIERQIAELKQEIANKNEKLIELEVAVAYDKKLIEIADYEKQARLEAKAQAIVEENNAF